MSEYTIIDTGVNINNVHITQSLYLQNYGNINGNINVNNPLRLYMYNSGTISGQIILNGNAQFFQMITNPSDITQLSVSGAHTINVIDANMLSLSAIASIKGETDTIILENSTLMLDCDFADLGTVRLVGNVFLYAPDENGIYNQSVPLSVSGDGRAYVYSGTSNPLMTYQTSVNDGQLYVRALRETDYVKILHNKTGEFLNRVRESNPDDKLLRALDSATSMAELNDIMSRSVRINPKLMMRPIRTFDDMLVNEFAARSDMPDGAVRAMYVISDDFSIYSGNFNIGLHTSPNFYVSAYGALGVLDWSDDINDFGAVMYGGGIRANYNISYTDIVRATFGATYADFDSDFVFDGESAKSAKSGTDIYGAMDFEHRFYFQNKFFVAPIIGVASHRSEIIGMSETDSILRGGINAGYGFLTYGLGYGYGFRAYMDSNRTLNAEAKMSIWSAMDAAGGDLTIGVVRADDYTAYKLSVGAHFMF